MIIFYINFYNLGVNMRTFLKVFVSSLFVFATMLGANEVTQPKGINTEKISEKSVQKFVTAAVQINVLKQSVQQELQLQNDKQPPSQEQIEQANQAFVQEAQKIIQSVGLSMNEYTQYAQLMQTDKQFTQRVNQAAQKLQN